jgi:hypothetical protein
MFRNLMFAILFAASAAAAAQTTQPKVALIPVLNLSGEKWAELKQRQSMKSDEFLRDAFVRRGFDVVGDREVAGAMARLDLDFADEEQQKRSTLFELGRKLGVDYILLGVITSTSHAQRDRTFYTDIEGRSDVKVWFLDVRNERAILSAKTFIGRSGGNRITLDNRGSDRQIQAAVNGFRDALKDFFAAYSDR